MDRQDYIKIIVRPSLANLELKEVMVSNGLNLKRLYAKDKESHWVLYAWLLGYPDFVIESEKIEGTSKQASEFITSLNGRLVRSNKNVYTLDK